MQREIKRTIETGVVAELNGKYWGCQYDDDRHCYSDGFGPIEKAEVSDPRYCRVPTDLTYARSPDVKQLRKAKLLKVKVTTIYEAELRKGEG